MDSTEVRYYLTDDRDQDDMELRAFRGGNGDWYLSICPQGDHATGHAVRITTSGSRYPGAANAVVDLYAAMRPEGERHIAYARPERVIALSGPGTCFAWPRKLFDDERLLVTRYLAEVNGIQPPTSWLDGDWRRLVEILLEARHPVPAAGVAMDEADARTRSTRLEAAGHPVPCVRGATPARGTLPCHLCGGPTESAEFPGHMAWMVKHGARAMTCPSCGTISADLRSFVWPRDVQASAPPMDAAAREPARHWLDTRCGRGSCGHCWRITPEQAVVGTVLICPSCGERTRVVDVSHGRYIRAAWPVTPAREPVAVAQAAPTPAVLSAWPPRDVVVRLIEATALLLGGYDCVAEGYERWGLAQQIAQRWLDATGSDGGDVVPAVPASQMCKPVATPDAYDPLDDNDPAAEAEADRTLDAQPRCGRCLEILVPVEPPADVRKDAPARVYYRCQVCMSWGDAVVDMERLYIAAGMRWVAAGCPLDTGHFNPMAEAARGLHDVRNGGRATKAPVVDPERPPCWSCHDPSVGWQVRSYGILPVCHLCGWDKTTYPTMGAAVEALHTKA